MTPEGVSSPSRGLAKTLTLRLVMTTIIAMLLQAAIVTLRDYFSETDFLNSYVRREATRLAAANLFPQQQRQGVKARGPDYYFGETAASYAFRIVDGNGAVVVAQNAHLLTAVSPWSEPGVGRQDFWVRKLNPDERMYVAGGLKVSRNTQNYWVELATIGDPANSYIRTIALDIFDDLWVPMLPLAFLTLLVTNLSVRRSLKPLAAAADHADAMSVLERSERLDVQQLPEEASHFALAVNRLLDRVADLIAANRLFMARAAHELRTPLSIMMLELGRLKEPGRQRLEEDVRAMSAIVDRLLLLARMESIPKATLVPVDVATVARELVSRMLSWVEKDGHALSFEAASDVTIVGDELAIREGLRNMIENAVKHTPAGTKIRVVVAADGSILVEDNGPGLGGLAPEELQQPFRKGTSTSDGAGLGLAIVRQAVELHGGRLEIGASPLGGARFVMHFPARPAASYDSH